jgi:hypothetical protein
VALWLDQDQYRADHAALRSCSHEIEADCLRTLSNFPAHSLAEQVEVDLPDRTDSKYLLPIDLLPRLLAALTAEHTVLESATHRIFTYENTYFDTPDWDLYLRHHNGNLGRHKCRLRRYHETDTAYLEIKLKNNKLRTIKNRKPWLAREPATALQDQPPMQPSLYVNYRRITLWNRATSERLTLDFDLHYRRPGQENTVRLPHMFVAELKREGKVYGSRFVRRAKSYGYTPQSFSKYCIGVCLTDNGELKTNRFKPMLRRLDIENNNRGSRP